MRNIKRTLAGLLVVAAVAAPAAVAASSGTNVTAHMDRTGTMHVSGYDGGAPLQP